ncbi:MAG: hypothetical protein ACP5N3_01275 [Candidatus Nanoarchaeia archaeon]
MNKKGVEGIKIPLYMIADLMIGVLVMVLLLIIVQKMLFGSVEEVVAKDISLTLMTVAASPYDLNLDYEKDTEKYDITINEEEVKVKSDEGYGSYKNLPMKGVSIQDSVIENTVSMPIIFKDSVIYFKDTESDYTDFCADIPLSFQDFTTIRLKVEIPDEIRGEARNKLEIIKYGIEIRSETESAGRITVKENSEDVLLVLRTSSGENAAINYYELQEDPSTYSYHRIACYMEKTLKEDFSTKFKQTKSEPFTEQKKIIIDIGDPNKIEASTASQLSTELYKALMLGLTD